MHETRTIDFAVGLFILLGLISALFLVTQTISPGALGGSDTYVVTARFAQVGDLKARAPVALSGVTIGRVVSIGVDPIDYQAIVKLRINADFDNLPIDTDAIIATSGLLGGKYIELTPGGDSEFLSDGGEIMFTQSAILLENLIGKYMLKGAGQ